MTLNIGVIGVGMIGREHISRLANKLVGAKVVALADVDAKQAGEIAAGLQGAKVYPSGEALIAAPEVQAVVVTSWGPTHESYVLASIKAGKPVFCEKPLAETEADCSAILDAEAALGRRLVQVGFMRRFDAQYRAMKETIASGAIGAPLIFQSGHRNPSVPGYYSGNPRTSENCLTESSGSIPVIG
jgi:myo-inositol 2-dehydrogenase / D-chiro-inositol 1-dehydrogenase